MVKNYLKIAFRNIIRHKTFSLINMAGSTIGMAGFMLIMIWIMHELSYDRFHRHADELCLVITDTQYPDRTKTFAETPGRLADELKTKYPEITPEDWPAINTNYIYLFLLVALGILIIAGVNYMNLSTARAASRIKEIGVRKSVGAFRRMLIAQFLGESLLIAFAAALLAILLIELTLPVFNSIMDKPLTLNRQTNLNLLLILFGIALLTGLLMKHSTIFIKPKPEREACSTMPRHWRFSSPAWDYWD